MTCDHLIKTTFLLDGGVKVNSKVHIEGLLLSTDEKLKEEGKQVLRRNVG